MESGIYVEMETGEIALWEEEWPERERVCRGSETTGKGGKGCREVPSKRVRGAESTRQ